MTTTVVDATPSTDDNIEFEALALYIDDCHRRLYDLHAQGEYVKLSDVSDILLDLRQKVKTRVSR